MIKETSGINTCKIYHSLTTLIIKDENSLIKSNKSLAWTYGKNLRMNKLKGSFKETKIKIL